VSTVLLDTHIFIWAIAQPDKLSAHSKMVLTDRRVKLLVSIASAWEIAIKVGVGKLELPADLSEVFARGCADLQAEVLPVDVNHAQEVCALPWHHRDPFDRMLVAQARVEGVPLMSYDQALSAYAVKRIGKKSKWAAE